MDKVERLLKDLKDVNAVGRENIIRELGEIGDSRAVKHLTDTALEDDSDYVRERAVNALCKMGDAVRVKPFIEALNGEDFITRLNAVYSLGRLGRPEAVKPLIDTAIRAKEVSVQPAAVEALTNIAKTGQTEAFIDALKDKYFLTREYAAGILAKIGWKASNNDDLALFLVAGQEWDNLVELGKDAAQPLINLLEDEDPPVVENAKEILRKIGDPGVFDLFITTFEKKKKAVQRKMLYLAVTGQWDKLAGVGEDAVKSLISVLTHKNAFIRRYAAQTLGKIGDTRARKPLTEKLKDKSITVRRGAVEALVKIADRDKPEPFIKLLKDSTAHARQAAADVLNKIGWKPSNNSESILYLTAMDQWEKLPKTGEETIAVLIDALNVLDADYRAKIVESLHKIKEPVLTERLIQALKKRNRHVRRGAADTLDKTGWKPLNNKESALYFMAKEEWEKLPRIGKDAGDILIDVLSFDDSTAREIAVEALGEIGDSRAVEALIKAMDDTKRIIREKAVEAFENLRIKILIEDFDFVCENCLLRYREYEASIKTALISVDTVTYMACPRCRSDSYFYVGIKKIVLVLDRNLKEHVMHEGDTLTVNWFKRTDSADRGCQIDYDEIRIIDADEYEIEKLIMKLKNDMDDQRRKRLPEIPVFLSPQLKLSPSKMNLLKDNFQIHEYPGDC